MKLVVLLTSINEASPLKDLIASALSAQHEIHTIWLTQFSDRYEKQAQIERTISGRQCFLFFETDADSMRRESRISLNHQDALDIAASRNVPCGVWLGCDDHLGGVYFQKPEVRDTVRLVVSRNLHEKHAMPSGFDIGFAKLTGENIVRNIGVKQTMPHVIARLDELFRQPAL